MRHTDIFQAAMSQTVHAEAIRRFPRSDLVTPQRLLAIAALCDPRNTRPGSPYYEMMMVKNLAFTLMVEWGWIPLVEAKLEQGEVLVLVNGVYCAMTKSEALAHLQKP